MIDAFEYNTDNEENPKFPGFYYLMLNKIQDILVVSNPYDAFILEEDRSLSEQLNSDYFDLSLSSAPRVVHASSGSEALEMLKVHKYGLVITMTRIVDMDAFEFGRSAKRIIENIPVVLMGYDTVEVNYFMTRSKSEKGIDKIFVWNGDSGILMAIVKHIEDYLNVEYDAKQGMIRVIIVVEDTPRYYSMFLPLLYQEIMIQTRELIYHSLSEREKKLRRRARPKVLLANNYDDAIKLYNEYKNNLLAVITDVRYPCEGVEDAKAGFKLIKQVKIDDPHLACLVQSSEIENMKIAHEMGARFIYKHADGFENKLRSFIKQDMGFGDFIFKNRVGHVVARAKNINEMSEAIYRATDESILYHSSENHFSNWFMARTEFRLAANLKPRKIEEFETIDDLRSHLSSEINRCIEERKRGVISNYSDSGFSKKNTFVRFGEGSIGGKARGIAFIDALLVRNRIHEKFKSIKIRIPKTFVISSDIFDTFMEDNDLSDKVFDENDDEKIIDLFMKSILPATLINAIADYLKIYKFPIAVRSSSLLEDAYYQPLAGIYSTYMLPNCNEKFEVRLKQLKKAIKIIYASAFLKNSKSYHLATSDRLKEEKMAIVIQELAGRKYGDYFYPCISGVAQSHNFYPISPMKAEDGVVQAGLGLGKIVVEGGNIVRFSPAMPEVNLNNYSVDSLLDNSQREFYALNLSEEVKIKASEVDNLELLPLEKAESDGTLFPVGSVYVAADGKIRDSLYHKGPRVVTFANILKYDLFPLGDIVREFLKIGRKGMGCPVEIEFAVNIDDPRKNGIEFFFLQIRPLVTRQEEVAINFDGIDFKDILCSTERALGNGQIEGINDFIFVKHDDFDPANTQKIADEIEKINEVFLMKKKRYVLAGPGRWGSSDSWLGIPVNWRQISSVGVIIETAMEGFNIDPSQGTHFFHNILSMGIGYLTINPGKFNEYINFELIKGLKPVRETEFLKHYSFENELDIRIHGRSGKAMIIATGDEIK